MVKEFELDPRADLWLVLDLDRGIADHRVEILNGLKPELMARWKGEKGRIGTALEDDLQVKAASNLLSHPKAYSRLLTPSGKSTR